MRLSLELAVAGGWTSFVLFSTSEMAPLPFRPCDGMGLPITVSYPITWPQGARYMIQTQPMIVPCLPGPSDLLEPLPLAMRTKDIDVFLLCCLKAKEWLLGPPVSITWHWLSAEGKESNWELQKWSKGTKSVSILVPSLESPGESHPCLLHLNCFLLPISGANSFPIWLTLS